MGARIEDGKLPNIMVFRSALANAICWASGGEYQAQGWVRGGKDDGASPMRGQEIGDG
jgi:hypothetical protein